MLLTAITEQNALGLLALLIFGLLATKLIMRILKAMAWLLGLVSGTYLFIRLVLKDGAKIVRWIYLKAKGGIIWMRKKISGDTDNNVNVDTNYRETPPPIPKC